MARKTLAQRAAAYFGTGNFSPRWEAPMASDLTPEETPIPDWQFAAREEDRIAGAVAAAVAAERERCGERLLSDEAVEAAWCAMDDWQEDAGRVRASALAGRWKDRPRVALSAAWRVVTGSNHE